MKKIIMMGDYFYNSQEYVMKASFWSFKSFLPMIKDAISDNIEITFNIKDNEGNEFSREYFYKLGGIYNVKTSYNEYDINSFNDEQIKYIKKFFNSDVIIIGFELYSNLTKFFTSLGCIVIDFAYHSYKLFDDLAFGIFTNNINIYNKLLKYQIPQDKFYYYANYWKTFMEYNGMIQDNDLEDNSVLFIGQTMVDKSVEKDGKFLNVTDYENKLKELSEKYSRIYYLPHPGLGKKRKKIYNWINKNPNIALLTNRSTYGLLASDKISKVVGISTSVLYEAQYFNKEVEYLYKPLFNIDASFEEQAYISIIGDYFNPKFWADILSPVCEVKSDVKNINYFKHTSNMLRNLGDAYWGYAQLDPLKRVTIKESLLNLYKQYIAPHF